MLGVGGAAEGKVLGVVGVASETVDMDRVGE